MTDGVATASPAELVEEIAREHEAITGARGSALEHALRCGELLLEAQRGVPKGLWVAWIKENLEIHPTTAFGYMRLARNADEVHAGNYSGIDSALEALSSGRSLSDYEKAEMVRLRRRGVKLAEIAEQFGVRKSTVHYWTSAKSRDRLKRLQRHARRRAREEARREAQRRAVGRVGGELAEAYGEVRRAAQKIDHELSAGGSGRRRMKLMQALDALYRAEDLIADAIREAV